VAEGRDWAVTDFLSALAHKAGVASTVWEDPKTQLHVFRAQRVA
jgi:AMMECR1 domain-containing protein